MFGLSKPQEWTREALCAQADPDLWFPDKSDWHSAVRAKLVCRRCPVQAECLKFALDNNEMHGVWGGLSPVQRLDLRMSRGITTSRLSVDDWHGTEAGARRHYREKTKVCERCRQAEKLARFERRQRA